MRSRLSVRWLASSAMVIAAWLPAHMASANLACQARASYPYSQPPVRVDFQALVANGVVPLGFHWDFGDGGSSTEQNPSHEYAQSKIYAVLLRVTDADAPQQVCRDTIPVYISTVVDPFCVGRSRSKQDVGGRGSRGSPWTLASLYRVAGHDRSK